MKMKSVLYGNGINIQFSNKVNKDDYKNYKIICRLMETLKTDKLDKCFKNLISHDAIVEIIEELNKYYNKISSNFPFTLKIFQLLESDDMITLMEILGRYNGKSSTLTDVSIEDYFYIMKIFNIYLADYHKEEPVKNETLYTGLKWLFLDAIYNGGEIEEIYKNMDCYRNELNTYDNIFTVNYDTNLEKLTSKHINYLHGDFNSLNINFDETTLIGFALKIQGKLGEYIKTMRHIFCNAVMGYSGTEKMNCINEVNNKHQDERCKAVIPIIPNYRDSSYPTDKLSQIAGEIDIIGMSPNNDSHIFKIVNENSGITKVNFYYGKQEDKDSAEKIIKKPLQLLNVFDYWSKF